MWSQIFSTVLTIRLQIVLEKEGTHIQFGASPNTGCLDISFFLRSMLQMNEELDIDSWVLLLL